MTSLTRQHLADLEGASRMAIDATLGVTGLVEHLHHTIQLRPGPFGRAPAAGRTRGLTGFVYRGVRGTTRLVGMGLDATLGPIAALFPAGESSPRRDAVVSAVNGVYGDYLMRSGNPLALDMSLRFDGRHLDPGGAALHAAAGARGGRPRLLLLVHGLCLNERHWLREGHDHGDALARDAGFLPVYLRYNSGLPVVENGRALARLLEQLLRGWPGPPPEVSGIGHSMGGLVLRSALSQAPRARQRWPAQVRNCVFLGTPHHGAPLERVGHGLDRVMDLSPYVAPFARLGRARSAGITDLRHGTITRGTKKFVPLPAHVRGYAVGATLCARQSPLRDRLVGDGLVPLDSALGRHPDPSRHFAIPRTRQWVCHETGHLDLLSSREVYDRLRDWLA